MQQLFMKIVTSLIVLSALNGCSNLNFSNKTAHQGNLSVVNKSKQLKIGMSKNEVKRLMGTSLIYPMFNQNRWDYSLTLQKPNKEVVIKSLVLYFKQDRLSRIIRK